MNTPSKVCPTCGYAPITPAVVSNVVDLHARLAAAGRERDTLAAKLAEMREALEKLFVHALEMIRDYRKRDFDLCRLAALDLESVEDQMERAQHALSPDCGKGWKSPEEYAALEAKCAEMRVLVNKTMSMTSCIFCGCSWPMGRTVEQTLRHEEECPMFHALSGDCGRDYVPRAELDEANEQIRKMKLIASEMASSDAKYAALKTALKECAEALGKAVYFIENPLSQMRSPTKYDCEDALAKAKEAL